MQPWHRQHVGWAMERCALHCSSSSEAEVGVTIKTEKKCLKLPREDPPAFFFFTFLKRKLSWVGGRRSEIIPVYREIVEELWGWRILSLLTDFTGILVLHSWWRLTYKTPGKLADSSSTTPKIERSGAQRECWALKSWVLSTWAD